VYFLGSNKKSVVIIGAGITGMPIALELCKKNFEVTILEKNPFVGGIATSIRNNGYTLDIGPHYVTLPNESDVTNEIYELVGKENVIKLPQSIRRSRKVFFRDKMWEEFPSISQLIKSLNLSSQINFGIEFFMTKILSNLGKYRTENAESYLISNYGKFLYNNWFKPYYESLYYNVDIPKKKVEEQFPPLSIQKALKLFKKSKNSQDKKATIPPKYFNCYFRNGMISLVEGLKEKIEKMGGNVVTNVNITEIHHEGKKKIIYSVNEFQHELDIDIIIYALPLNIAQKWFKPKSEIRNEKSALNSIMVFLFVDDKRVFDNWIIDVFDKKISSWRIAQQSYLSDSIAPENKSLLSVEIRAKEDDSIWNLNDDGVYKIVCNELEKMKILNSEKIDGYKIIKLRNVYPLNVKNNSEKQIKNLINSHNNEYGIGIEIDSGILIADEAKDDLDKIPRLGGVFRAMANAKIFVDKIT